MVHAAEDYAGSTAMYSTYMYIRRYSLDAPLVHGSVGTLHRLLSWKSGSVPARATYAYVSNPRVMIEQKKMAR